MIVFVIFVFIRFRHAGYKSNHLVAQICVVVLINDTLFVKITVWVKHIKVCVCLLFVGFVEYVVTFV